jgi:hypothetical protein
MYKPFKFHPNRNTFRIKIHLNLQFSHNSCSVENAKIGSNLDYLQQSFLDTRKKIRTRNNFVRVFQNGFSGHNLVGIRLGPMQDTKENVKNKFIFPNFRQRI